MTSDVHRLLPRVLPRKHLRRTVVVVADDDAGVAGLDLAHSRYRRAHVVPVVGRSEAELHQELAALSAVHLVVDVRPSSGPSQRDAFELAFFHLAPRGAWVALRSTGGEPGPEPLVDLAGLFEGPKARKRVGKRWHEHLASATDVRVSPELVVIGKRKKHLLRLPEDQAPALLSTREPGLRVTEVARFQPGTLDTTGRTHDHGVEPFVHVPEVLSYPEHVVRRYDGVVHLPRGPVAYHRRTLL